MTAPFHFSWLSPGVASLVPYEIKLSTASPIPTGLSSRSFLASITWLTLFEWWRPPEAASPHVADEREDWQMGEDGFVDRVAERLAGLPTVEAVALGGSRAEGTERPDSDWDFAIYYRGPFDPQDLRDIGWPGRISQLGGWGGGVFNGGAWLKIEGRKADIHYRDLDSVSHEMAESSAGRFRIEPLLFHLAGIPSYLVVAELALNRVLYGQLPKPHYPEALRTNAPPIWSERANPLFAYARTNYARRGQLAQCLGLVVQAASCSAHAILAARAEWVTNEKALLTRAGLSDLDRIFAEVGAESRRLEDAVDESRDLCWETLRRAGEA